MQQENWYTIWMKSGRAFQIKAPNLKRAIVLSRVLQRDIAATRTGQVKDQYVWTGKKLKKK